MGDPLNVTVTSGCPVRSVALAGSQPFTRVVVVVLVLELVTVVVVAGGSVVEVDVVVELVVVVVVVVVDSVVEVVELVVVVGGAVVLVVEGTVVVVVLVVAVVVVRGTVVVVVVVQPGIRVCVQPPAGTEHASAVQTSKSAHEGVRQVASQQTSGWPPVSQVSGNSTSWSPQTGHGIKQPS